MSDKVLVAYASRAGSTAGVAEEIGEILRKEGIEIDVLPVQEVEDVTGYSAVIVGSAIQNRQWLPEAVQFVQDHREALAQRPVAIFLVCMTLTLGNGKYRNEVATWLAPVRAQVRPVSEGLFAGALDVSKIPAFADRMKFRLSVLFRVWTEGDHRDWQAIRAWAEQTGPLLISDVGRQVVDYAKQADGHQQDA